MDISTLKEYVRLNNRRLSPAITDCSDPTLYREFANTAREIEGLHHKVSHFFSETQKGGQERFRFGDVTITAFLLMCIPLLLGYIIGEHLFSHQAGAAFGYIVTLIILVVRIYLQGFASHFRVATVGHFLRIVLLLVCAYLHVFKQVTFFGTTGIWVFIYIIISSLITLFIRSFDIKRVKEHQAEFAEYLETIDKLDELLNKCETLYVSIGDKAEGDLKDFIKANNLHITPSIRNVWFRFKRDPVSYPSGNNATVDFKAPFEEKTDFKTDNHDYRDYKDENGRGFYEEDNPYKSLGIRGKLRKEGVLSLSKDVTVQTYINSQDFGWVDLSERAAKKLLDEGKIYPYYGMEIPEFLPELKYSFFRHYYDITIKTITDTIKVESVPSLVESKKQKEFRQERAFEEARHHYEDIKGNAPPHLQEKIIKYEESKEKTYKSLADFEEKTSYFHDEKSENKKADEIGGMLVFTPDGELVGVYAGDTVQSLEFVSKEIKKHTNFVPSIYSQPFGYSQIQEMRNRYFS